MIPSRLPAGYKKPRRAGRGKGMGKQNYRVRVFSGAMTVGSIRATCHLRNDGDVTGVGGLLVVPFTAPAAL